MNKRIWILLISIIILLTSCASGSNSILNKDKADKPVPDWLVSAIKAEFQNPDIVKPNDITFLQVRLKETNEPQILAYLTVDRLNGVIMLFENQGGEYKLVYKKNEPIYGVQIFGSGNNQIATFISGLGGTGVQENYFHMLGSTEKGYKEIWRGIAEKFKFTGALPHIHIQGAVNFDMTNTRMIYTQNIRVYSKPNYDIDMPDRVSSTTYNYKYNQKAGQFLLIIADENIK